MAFLFKAFSGSERLKEKQKSADIVNQTFQAELVRLGTCSNPFSTESLFVFSLDSSLAMPEFRFSFVQKV